MHRSRKKKGGLSLCRQRGISSLAHMALSLKFFQITASCLLVTESQNH